MTENERFFIVCKVAKQVSSWKEISLSVCTLSSLECPVFIDCDQIMIVYLVSIIQW